MQGRRLQRLQLANGRTGSPGGWSPARTTGAGEWVHYAASKAALDALTRGAARELAGEGIRVNAVAPGLIQTDLHVDNGQPDRPERLRSSVPMCRIGEPEEVARAVLWLLSGEASYVTGTVIEIRRALSPLSRKERNTW